MWANVFGYRLGIAKISFDNNDPQLIVEQLLRSVRIKGVA